MSATRNSVKLLEELEQRFVRRPRTRAVCLVFCAMAAFFVFVFPFFVPVPYHPAISASYIAGFNNRAAAISAALLSLLAAFWSWQRHRAFFYKGETQRWDAAKVNRWAILCAIACTIAFTALADVAVQKSGERYLADAGYFIEQMSKHAQFGGKLYQQLEFAYGPLLFYPTILLRSLLGCSMFTAYFITLGCEQTLGLIELAYVLNVLPVSARLRTFTFLLFALGCNTPLLGLNYTYFRYLTPLALLLVVLNTNRFGLGLRTAILGPGAAISFGISAELGLAFCVGAGGLLLVNRTADWKHWFLPACGVGAGALLFAMSAGRPYFQMLRAFAMGGLNLPVVPYPHLVVFLFAVVWIAPFGLGRVIARWPQHKASVVTCYAFSLALLPSALGRCDPLHVFFVGIVFSLLSLTGLSTTRKSLQMLWCSSLCVLMLWQVGVTNKLFRFRTADTLSAVLPVRVSTRLAGLFDPENEFGQHFQPEDGPPYELDVTRMEEKLGSAKVATPFEIPVAVEDALRRSGHFRSDYFAYMVDTFNAPAEQRAIQDLDSADWALVPKEYPQPFIETPSDLQDLQGFVFPLPKRHNVPFMAGEALTRNLALYWTKVDELGPYLLLHRRAELNHRSETP